MKYLIAIACIASLGITGHAYLKHREAKRVADEALWRIEWRKHDCEFGFNGSVIFHGREAYERGTHADPDLYLTIKSECDQLGTGPLRTDDPATRPPLDYYVNLLRGSNR